MSVDCITCDNFSLRGAGDMAKRGFGNCKHSNPWVFQSATKPRECAQHAPAALGQAEERLAWIERQKA